jgi:hypothetical protein
VAGAVLLPLGDRNVSRPVFPQAPSLKRDPMPVATALARELSIGPIPVPMLVADGLATVAAAIGIFALRDVFPWPALWLGAAAIYTVIAVELFYYAIPARIRRAWEGIALIGNPEMKRWRAATGRAVPTSPAAMHAFLRDVPDAPELRFARAELLATLGELDDARRVADEMPVPTESDRFEQRATLAWIDWLDGDESDVDRLAAEAELVGDAASDERFTARARVAMARARDIATRGGDWKAPLQELQAQRPAQGAAALRSDMRRARYRAEPLVALIFTGLLVQLSTLRLF